MLENRSNLIQIRDIEAQYVADISQVVNVHMETFQGFFLTFLGKGFLRQMYHSYCEHEYSGLVGAYDKNDRLVGFLAYSADLSGLYKFMIKKRLIAFAWFAVGAFLRKPKVFMRLVRAFLKPGESKRKEDYVELASIGVRPDAKACGVGSGLISELKRRVDFEKYAYITLETDALNNESANQFYLKNGFILERTYATHEGRLMNEYRYRG